MIEIEKKDYAGEAKELLGGSEVFTSALSDDDFVYQPLRMSTAKMTIVASDEMQGIYATAYQQYRITLLLGSAPVWCGHIKPEEYTQDYNSPAEEIEVECLSALSTLAYVKYTQVDTSGLQFVSLKSLLGRAISAANGRYNKIYMPHTFSADAASYGINALMRDDCVISEQNFFDEEDKPMMFSDVIEEICRFAHMTVYDCGGNIFFVDHDYADAYDEYSLQAGALVLTTSGAITRATKSVQSIGFTGNAHKLDIIAGYNKATIKVSNYNNSDKVFPEETWDNLEPLAIETVQQTIVQALKTGTSVSYTETIARSKCIWLTPNKWETHMYLGTGLTEDGRQMSALEVGSRGGYYYDEGKDRITEAVTEVADIKTLQWDTTDEAHVFSEHFAQQQIWETNQGLFTLELYVRNDDGQVYGAFLGKYCQWEHNADGTDSISSYSYDHVMFLRKNFMLGNLTDHGTSVPIHNTITFDPKKYKGFFNYKGHMPVAAYADGAIAIDLQAALTLQGMGGGTGAGFYYACEKSALKSGVVITFTFLLRIGGTYYNGTSWTAAPATFTVTTEKTTESSTFVSLKNTKVLSMPYNDLTGYIVETVGTLKGELFFELVDVDRNCAIKDFGMKFQLKDNYVPTDNASDRTYTNAVNSEYINELEEIEEKISSYNHDGLCYSKVLLGNDFITDNLYEGINKTTTRPENLLLRRIVNQYSEPKFRLTQVLKYDDSLRPIDRLLDEYQGASKSFILSGAETDYADESSTITMIEKE